MVLKKILVATANPDSPDNSGQIRTDRFVSFIQTGLKRGQVYNNYDIETCLATDLENLLNIIEIYRPNILHLIGHGQIDNKFVFETKDGKQLAVDEKKLLPILAQYTSELECVVISACYSADLARKIANKIAHAVGFDGALGVEIAKEYCELFYYYIANNGYEQADIKVRERMKGKGHAEDSFPSLYPLGNSKSKQQVISATTIYSLLDTDLPTALVQLQVIFNNYVEYEEIIKEYDDNKSQTIKNIKSFVKSNKDFINTMLKSKGGLSTTILKDNLEESYAILCKLNFEHQYNYFEALLKDRKLVLPFIIRGRKNYGQMWLCYRLISHYKNEVEDIHDIPYIDFEQSNIDNIDAFIDSLASVLEFNANANLDYSSKLDYLISHIKRKVIAKPLIFIFENAFNFMASTYFENVINILCKIEEKINHSSNHKCIFFFLEHSQACYNKSDYIHFSIKQEISYIRACDDLKLIDLNETEQIQDKDFSKWVDNLDPTNFARFNPQLSHIKQTLLTTCNEGHPDKVIEYLCSQMGINYKELMTKKKLSNG